MGTPNWLAEEGHFKCPCCGSTFTIAGEPLTGSAREPLYRVGISLSVDNDIIVDKRFMENQKNLRDKPPFFLALK